MALTSNLGLYKPLRQSNVFVSTDINGNMDIIDEKTIRKPIDVGTITNSSASAADIVVSIAGDYTDMIVLSADIGNKHAFNSLSVVFTGSAMEVHANVKASSSSTLILYLGYQNGGRSSNYTYDIDIDHDEWQEIDKIGNTPMGTTATTLTGAIKEQGDLIKDGDKKMAIVVNGNTSTDNITAGDYVIVEDSAIGGITDGLYIAVNSVVAGTPLLSTDLDNTDTAKGGLNALNNKLGWKYIDNKKGTTSIALPADAKEYLFVARYGTSGGAQALAFTFSIPNNANLWNGITLSDGYHSSSSTYALAQVTFYITSHAANLALMSVSGVDYTSNSYLFAFYR